MKNTRHIKLTLLLAIPVLIAYALFCITSPSLAEENKNLACKKQMQDYIDKVTPEFGQKLDNLLLGKDDASASLDSAMIQFRNYKKDLLKKFNEVYSTYSGKDPNNNSYTFFSQLSVKDECYQIVDEAIKDAQTTFMNLTAMNAHIKKTTRLINKFQGLNQKIHDLVYKFGIMKGQFDGFASRIPNWTVECL